MVYQYSFLSFIENRTKVYYGNFTFHQSGSVVSNTVTLRPALKVKVTTYLTNYILYTKTQVCVPISLLKITKLVTEGFSSIVP